MGMYQFKTTAESLYESALPTADPRGPDYSSENLHRITVEVNSLRTSRLARSLLACCLNDKIGYDKFTPTAAARFRLEEVLPWARGHARRAALVDAILATIDEMAD